MRTTVNWWGQIAVNLNIEKQKLLNLKNREKLDLKKKIALPGINGMIKDLTLMSSDS